MDPVDPQAEVENANNNNSGLIVSGDADVGSWSNNENKIINEPKIDIRIETSKSDLAVQQQLSEIARLRTKLEGRKNALVNFEDRVECIKREKREYEYRVEKLKMEISLLESRLSDEIRRRGEYEAEAQKRCKELEAKVDRKRAALDKQKENVQKLEKEISVLESKLSEERAGKIRTEEDAQRQREKLEAEIKNKRRALQKRTNQVNRRRNEVSTLDSKLSDEINRREKLEAETQRERQELEASIKQKHLQFLDIWDLHEKTIAAQKKEISSLGCKLSDEIRNVTEYKEKVELEQQALMAVAEKERCTYLDMQKQNESLIVELKVEISRFSTMLSEASSQKTALEAEALRLRQQLESAMEKERSALFDLQEQKTVCEKQDAELSELESRLLEEIHLKSKIEAAAQQDRQELESALEKGRCELLHMETLIGEKKEVISQLDAKLSEESRCRAASEEEAQRRCQELEAAVEKGRGTFLDLQEQKTACERQHAEKISMLKSKLLEEKCCKTKIEAEAQRERQEFESALNKERRSLLDKETLIGKKKEEISLLGARLSEESRRRVGSEEEVQRRCRELEDMKEKERLVSLDLKKQKEEVSTLNSKLSAEISHRERLEAETQQERQRLQKLPDETRQELVRTHERHENAAAAVKEVTSAVGPGKVPRHFQKAQMGLFGKSSEESSPHDFEEALRSFSKASETRPNLDVIVTGAEESLHFFKSWIEFQSKDPVVLVFIDGIQKQSGPYVTAIDQSVKTAEQGSAFSADAIGFCDFLLDPDATREDLAEYASEMSYDAGRVVQAATEVLNLFRDIRVALFQIAANMDATAATAGLQKRWYESVIPLSSQAQSVDPEKALEGLQKLTVNVERFAGWWVDMETTLNLIKEMGKAGRGRLRIKQLKQSWRKVDEDYKTYKRKFYAVRDQTRAIQVSA